MINPGFQPGMVYTQPMVQVQYWDPSQGYGHLNGYQKLERDYGLLIKQRANLYFGCCHQRSVVTHIYPLAEDQESKKASKILKSQIPKNVEGGCCPSCWRPFEMFINHKNYNEINKDDLPFLSISRACSLCCNADLDINMKEDGQNFKIGKIGVPCCSCMGPHWNIYDKNDNIRYMMEQSCCEFLSKCCCGGDLVLDVRTPDNQTVGKIGKTRKPRDFG